MVAWMLTGLPDPVGQRTLAGELDEMVFLAAYSEVLRELYGKLQTTPQAKVSDDNGPDEPENAAPRRTCRTCRQEPTTETPSTEVPK